MSLAPTHLGCDFITLSKVWAHNFDMIAIACATFSVMSFVEPLALTRQNYPF
jgi:hypothetical protein